MKLSAQGYTLIELLVVMSIMSIMAVVGFVNFKDFSSDQVAIKAAGQIQSYLRLAQSNATSSTICNGQGVTSWSLIFPTGGTTIELHCDPNNYLKNTYTLENARVALTGDSGCLIGFQATIRYLVGVGTQKLSSTDTSTQATCLDSSTITFTVTNTKNPSVSPQPSFNISKGGAINVQ